MMLKRRFDFRSRSATQSPRHIASSSPTLTRSPKMGKRALHRGPHKTSLSSLNSRTSTPPPPPPPPPPLPPPLPPYPSIKCIESYKSSDSTSQSNYDRSFNRMLMEKNLDRQYIADKTTDRRDETIGYRDLSRCNSNLWIQAQVQHLLIENCKSTNSNPSLDKLLLDSSKLGISQSDLHRILSQQLAKYKKCSNSPSPSKYSVEYEQFENYKSDSNSIERGDKSTNASRDSELQMAELSMSLDSWKPSSRTENSNNNHAASMPELTPQSNGSTYRAKAKGNLSVRFENEEDDDLSENNNFRPSKHQRRRKNDDDTDSYCSTCSSSSSSDDPTVYQLPPRRPYAGGVRISYVPNDKLAFAKRQQSIASRSPNKKQPQPTPPPSADDKSCVIS